MQVSRAAVSLLIFSFQGHQAIRINHKQSPSPVKINSQDLANALLEISKSEDKENE